MHLTFLTSSEDETLVLGSVLAGVLRAGDVVGLDGELGAGKTRLVRGIADGLAIDPALVSSPTYVLIHQYPPSPSNPLNPELIHVDAYRLSGPEELDSIGWDRVIDGSSVVVIEWADRLRHALDEEPSLARVHIEGTGASDRRITLIGPRSWEARAGYPRLAALAQRSGMNGDRCPVCDRPAGPLCAAPWSPFCSEKCRLADLGKWLTGRYVVSRSLEEDDLNDPDLEPGSSQA